MFRPNTDPLVPRREPKKGIFSALNVKALPQGGYVVEAPLTFERHGSYPEELAAFTTLDDALVFVARNMR